MKFVKGMLIGTLLSAGAVMMYKETTKGNKKRMMRKGKKMIQKMGII